MSSNPSPHETDKLCRVDLHERFHPLRFSPEAPCCVVAGGECQALETQRDLWGWKHEGPSICPPTMVPECGLSWRVPQHPHHSLA